MLCSRQTCWIISGGRGDRKMIFHSEKMDVSVNNFRNSLPLSSLFFYYTTLQKSFLKRSTTLRYGQWIILKILTHTLFTFTKPQLTNCSCANILSPSFSKAYIRISRHWNFEIKQVTGKHDSHFRYNCCQIRTFQIMRSISASKPILQYNW